MVLPTMSLLSLHQLIQTDLPTDTLTGQPDPESSSLAALFSGDPRSEQANR